jgi:signal transduction histidine kinase
MFESARNKLTGWYLLIIMIISGAFSWAMYRVLTREVDRFVDLQRYRIERRMMIVPGPNIAYFDEELIYDIKKRIKLFLLAVNGTVFVVAGGLAYFLAGRTLKPISAMIEEQQRFVSDASHELKTPLTSLKSAFEVFLRDEKSNLTDAKQLVKESISEVDKLQKLSESMLNLTGAEVFDKTRKLETVNLGDVITLAVKRVEALAKKKGITIDSDNQKIMVKGVKDELIDIAVILLDNAIKYSDSESQVEIRSARNETQGILEVKDWGMGIDKNDQEKIFDRFYRADTSRSKESKNGYGLGLAIAKKLAEANKASISVKSALGKGSVFTLKLAIAK